MAYGAIYWESVIARSRRILAACNIIEREMKDGQMEDMLVTQITPAGGAGHIIISKRHIGKRAIVIIVPPAPASGSAKVEGKGEEAK